VYNRYMSKCYKCKLEKHPDDFGNDKSKPSGKTSICKPCHSEKARLYRDKYKAAPRLVASKVCPSCNLELSSSEFHKGSATSTGLATYCKKCISPMQVASRYKLSVKAYSEMISSGCDSCGSFEKLCIDHDHSCCSQVYTCGKCIRGVLCNECNSAEGFLKTSDKAAKLLQYMIKNGL